MCRYVTDAADINFRKENKLRMQWVVTIRRHKWRPKDASVVCRWHFNASDHQMENTSGKHAFALPYVFCQQTAA